MPKQKNAEKETEAKKEEQETRQLDEKERQLALWVPKTALGKMVKNGEIASVDELFASNKPILEPEIVDSLLQIEESVVDLAKTTRVIRSGRRFSFRASVLIGNRNGYVGIGTAKDAEKWPAVRKATRNAKLNLVKVNRGCGSWECVCGEQHTVPFKVVGKCASVRVTLLPAPRGIGLVVGDNIKDVLLFAGVKDVWSKTKGATTTKLNFIRAAIDALSKTAKMKASDPIVKKFGKEK